MPTLHTQLRNRLEAAVKAARRTGEAAAKVALERLTVGSAEPGTHLSADERQLRNRLRAHGRQLGDQRDPKTGVQKINRLIHECAYEHWHRMLFARFLAENHLLIHEKEGMPVTLAECDELAKDERAPDGWTLAARYAARMLPQIFRPDDPVLQVGFAPEHKRVLEKLVADLPVEVFTAEDSLGWVYQFWQAERKDEVNASGDKITGETLPAVTQLFTEHYMVLFLLHNTIGALWAARQKAEGRIPKAEWDKCQTEDDCRKLVSLPGYEFTYLRFIKDGNGEWVPAAGTFPGWQKSLKDFKLLDPCCGSGHFLVAAFVLLALLRMRDEKLTAKDACDAVLRENLHGLELDPRCTQIAAFALALTAWKFTEGFRPLPPLNIACSGLGVNARKEDWLALANGDKSLLYGMEQLHELFQKASELGSLINPRSVVKTDPHYVSEGDVFSNFTDLRRLLTKALESEQARKNDDLNEISVAAQGMAHAANMLANHYTLVVTNVPYLGRGKHNDVLRDYFEAHHPEAKTDLATCFVERCVQFCDAGSTISLVCPQNWLFLGTYKGMRLAFLKLFRWDCVVKLGPRAFETISGEVVNVSLIALTNEPPLSDHTFVGLDVADEAGAQEKAAALRISTAFGVNQESQLRNVDARITLDTIGNVSLLADSVICHQGLATGDLLRFGRCFWEIPKFDSNWVPWQSTVEQTIPYGGRSNALFWENGQGQLHEFNEAAKAVRKNTHLRGSHVRGKLGIIVTQMGAVPVTLYTGEHYDDNTTVLLPKTKADLLAIWAFCSSAEYSAAVRLQDSSMKVPANTLAKVPFDLPRWQHVAAEKLPNGLPEPASNNPTQWLFAGHPVDSTAPLQVGVARLIGYRWPRQTGQTVSGAAPVPEDGLEKFVDEDGIVCIPSVRGEAPAAERLRALLATAFGKTWSPAKLDELLSTVDFGGSNLEDWLRNGFFDQHCKLFHHRPFIWQIWDGRKDGFSALVNYHKLDNKLLGKLAYTYLGEWIKKQREARDNGEGGADDRLLKAEQLQKKLELILEGEAPYDIFVRWKVLEKQPIGWNPDLNDGVRLNIRPFVQADVLRKRPNIKWGKDRGKNPRGSPWGEERDNDQHLTLAEKQKCRKGTI